MTALLSLLPTAFQGLLALLLFSVLAVMRRNLD